MECFLHIIVDKNGFVGCNLFQQVLRDFALAVVVVELGTGLLDDIISWKWQWAFFFLI